MGLLSWVADVDSEHIEREAAIGAAAVLAHARPDLCGAWGCRRLRVRAVPAPAAGRAVDVHAARIVCLAMARAAARGKVGGEQR